MNGYEVMAQALKAEGVEFMVAFPAQTLIDVGAQAGIRPIICRQERAGVNMADGFSRVTNGRKIGVFTMQRGPGAENAFGGVAQAFADSVPLLALPGGEPLSRRGIHPTFDATPNYQSVTKWSAVIHTPADIASMVRRAFAQLKHGRLGPVLVEMPGDVMAAEVPAEAANYIPVQRRLSSASAQDVRELVTALLKASDPIINAGQGVMYAEATPELIEFAELTKIPVMTTLAGKSAFPETHPLALGTGSHLSHLDGPSFPRDDGLCTRGWYQFHLEHLYRRHALKYSNGPGHELRRRSQQGLRHCPWGDWRRETCPAPND